ncbi:hypothetical protein IPF37_00345 [bacterium]|nr:MAG: hypothetical protein IPF37_00345 [bacterium]
MKRYVIVLLMMVIGIIGSPDFCRGSAAEIEEFSVPVPAMGSVSAMLEQLGIDGVVITETIVFDAYKRCMSDICFVHSSPRDLSRAKANFEKAYNFLLDYIYRSCVESIDIDGSYCPACRQEEYEKKFTPQELRKKLDQALTLKRREFADFPDRLAFLDRAEFFLKKNLMPKYSPLRC